MISWRLQWVPVQVPNRDRRPWFLTSFHPWGDLLGPYPAVLPISPRQDPCPAHPLLSPQLGKSQPRWNSPCPHPGMPLGRTRAPPVSILKKPAIKCASRLLFWVARFSHCVHTVHKNSVMISKKSSGSRQSLAGSHSFQAIAVRYLTLKLFDVACFLTLQNLFYFQVKYKQGTYYSLQLGKCY